MTNPYQQNPKNNQETKIMTNPYQQNPQNHFNDISEVKQNPKKTHIRSKT
jgi:hypothetical protein